MVATTSKQVAPTFSLTNLLSGFEIQRWAFTLIRLLMKFDLCCTGDQGTSARSKYECATCKRTFKSHQALGGHRASHKKVKGCFARTNVNDGGAHEQSQESMEADDEEMLKSEEQLPNEHQENSHNNSEEDTKPCYLATARDNDNEEILSAAARKSKAHECTICGRVFTSGQALGGHKRCHWVAVEVECLRLLLLLATRPQLSQCRTQQLANKAGH